MMSRHFRLSSELTGAMAKKLSHAKNQLSAAWQFLQSIRYRYIYIYYVVYTQTNKQININRVLIVRISDFSGTNGRIRTSFFLKRSEFYF